LKQGSSASQRIDRGVIAAGTFCSSTNSLKPNKRHMASTKSISLKISSSDDDKKNNSVHLIHGSGIMTGNVLSGAGTTSDRSRRMLNDMNVLVRENFDLKNLITQLKFDLEYQKQRENKIMYLFFSLDNRGYPVNSIYE
jgi:hypothetical protein